MTNEEGKKKKFKKSFSEIVETCKKYRGKPMVFSDYVVCMIAFFNPMNKE